MKSIQNKLLKMLLAITLILLQVFIPLSVSYAELYMSISGTMKDAVTGNGISGVEIIAIREPVPPEISLVIEELHYTNTDENGNFILEFVPPGTYSLFIKAPSDYVKSNKPFPITVDSGKNVSGLDIRLDKAGSVAGKVFQQDGVTPITGATVAAYTSEENLSYGETDDSGEYVIHGLKETNSCTVVVLPDGYGLLYKENIHVSSEQITTGIDFVLNPDLSTGIYGIVTDQNGSPISNAIIIVHGKIGGAKTVTDSSGNYSIVGLFPENYTATVIASGYEGLEESNIQVFDGTSTNINFSVNQQNSMNTTLLGTTSINNTLIQTNFLGLGECESCKITWHLLCSGLGAGGCLVGCAFTGPAVVPCELACHFLIAEPFCMAFSLAHCNKSGHCQGVENPPPGGGGSGGGPGGGGGGWGPGGDHPDDTFSVSN